MSIVLSEWVTQQSRQRIVNIGARGIKLNYDEIYRVLSHMGEVMSLAKLHRKIAVTYAVLQMEIGQVLPAEVIVVNANEIVRPQAQITLRSCGHIMRLLMKWGLIERIWDGKHWEYRRVA